MTSKPPVKSHPRSWASTTWVKSPSYFTQAFPVALDVGLPTTHKGPERLPLEKDWGASHVRRVFLATHYWEFLEAIVIPKQVIPKQ